MKIKNTLALILSVLMLVTLLPFDAAAEEIGIIEVEEPEEEPIPVLTTAELEPSAVSRTISDSYVNPLYADLADTAAAAAPTALRTNVVYEECEGLDGLAALLKQGMLRRSDTVSFLMHADQALDLSVKSLSEAACAHSGAPKEGDYLLLHFVSGNLNCAEIPTGSGYDYEGQIRLSYLTTAAQESQLDAAAASLLNELQLDGKSELEKAAAVYAAVCGRVAFDDTPDGSETLKNTAYAALVEGEAYGRGFAALLYRLMLEAGVDGRAILGRGNGQDHAWNILRIGELYYNADAAYDAGSKDFSWFLKGSGSFVDHTRNREYLVLSFTRAYPMGEADVDLDGLKPAISKQPKSVTAYAGDTVEFSVEASGSDLSYQWYYRTSSTGSWKTCSGADAQSANISIEAKTYRSGYQYRCRVENWAGSVESAAAKLTVKELMKPEIQTQPRDQVVTLGGMAPFTVKAEGGALSYQWYYRKSETGSWSKCSGESAMTAVFTVEAKAYRFGYQYRCLVKNSAGSTYTEAASLLILPSITAQPVNATAPVGETVTFTVKAEVGTLSYQWYFAKPGSDSWSKCSGDSARTDCLSVEVKSYRDGYRYRCAVSNAAGSVNSEAAVLSMAAKPVITAQPAEAAAGVGTMASFRVQAEGEGLSYQWYFRKSDADSWTKCSGDSAVTAVLSVEAKTYRNGYQYRCKVSNAVGSVTSASAALKILPVIDRQPEDVTAALGETAVFTVKASGLSLSYQWQFRKSETDAWTKCSGDSAATASLSVEARSYRSGYQYRCRITDTNGTVYTKAATLTVS